MTSPFTGVGAISLFSEDLAASTAFYADVLGLAPLFSDDVSAAFQLGGTVINVLLVGEAPELIEPAPVAAAGTGSRLMLTMWVTDCDAVAADLTDKGVALLNGPLDRPWGVRTAAFADPAGHVWEIAQQLGG